MVASAATIAANTAVRSRRDQPDRDEGEKMADSDAFSPEDEFNSLLAAYTVERQDDAAALTLAFSMATAAFTYMIAASIFFTKCKVKEGCGDATAAQFVAPAIPVAILSFIVLGTAATLMRSVELQTIEARLLGLAKQLKHTDTPYTPIFHTNAGLVWRSFQVKDQPPIRLAFGIAGMAAYLIIYASPVIFTIYVLHFGQPWSWQKWSAAIFYCALELLILVAALISITHSKFKFAGGVN
jgi:hypothetical protein